MGRGNGGGGLEHDAVNPSYQITYSKVPTVGRYFALYGMSRKSCTLCRSYTEVVPYSTTFNLLLRDNTAAPGNESEYFVQRDIYKFHTNRKSTRKRGRDLGSRTAHGLPKC